MRSLDLGEHGRLTTTYRVDPAEKGLAANFHVDGFVNVPELIAIEPSVETWVRKGPGHIEGNFVMVWKTNNKGIVRGEATTQYRLDSKASLPGVQFRSIEIAIRTKGSVLEQDERIVLFGAEGIKRIAG